MIELKSPTFTPLSSSQLDEASESFKKMLDDHFNNTELVLTFVELKYDNKLVVKYPYYKRIPKNIIK